VGVWASVDMYEVVMEFWDLCRDFVSLNGVCVFELDSACCGSER
jgi:hypothetical protein